jgi:hypothetical protein
MKTNRVWVARLGLAGLLAAHAGVAADLKPSTKPAVSQVAVYVKQDNLLIADLGRAEQAAVKVFARIGVAVVFRPGVIGKSEDGAFRIELQLDSKAPAQLHAGALAYAAPFGTSGTRIRIFCDRVRNASPETGPGIALGYVMTHEIAHVLEGVSRHSEGGVMKAHWGSPDYRQMKALLLTFDPADDDLIHDGLERNAARTDRTKQSR